MVTPDHVTEEALGKTLKARVRGLKLVFLDLMCVL